jgi:uncharacterized protein YbcI
MRKAGREAIRLETQEPRQSPSQAISTGTVRLLQEYTGRGPTKAKTTINQDSVMIVLGETLTKAERKLAETGKADRVLQVRHDFQVAMGDDLVALVEQELDRKVVAFMSDNHIDPDVAVEVFLLEPIDERSVSA